MEWAALDGLKVVSDKVRTIGTDIEETLLERNEERHFYSWVFSDYPASWGAGTGLSGSLRVFEQDASVFVEYGMWTNSDSEEGVAKNQPFLQKQVDDVIPKLVKFIENK